MFAHKNSLSNPQLVFKILFLFVAEHLKVINMTLSRPCDTAFPKIYVGIYA